MKLQPKILVVRRDNIGDLVCTTPLLHAIRCRYPDAYVAVLASSYNFEVLDNNPDVDAVFVFVRRQQYGALKRLWKRWCLILKLRRHKFDYVILANGGWRYAKTLGGKFTIGFHERDNSESHQPDVVVPLKNRGADDHEVIKMAMLGAVFGVDSSTAISATHLYPRDDLRESISKRLTTQGWMLDKPTLVVHISSRRSVQRWPEESFVIFSRELVTRYGVQIILLWSPGTENDPLHPGDDQKAERIMSKLRDVPVFPYPTTTIPELVAVVSIAQQMICSDGGAMHVAAGLAKPILCFFGDTSPVDWHPWHVPYVLLQKQSRLVSDITPAEAVAGFGELQSKLYATGEAALQETPC